MNKFMSLVFFVYFFVSSAFLWVFAATLCLFVMPFDRNRWLVHQFSCAWGYHYIWMNPMWRVHFEGKEQIDKNKTYVYVANHQSLADILVIYGLYFPFKWVSKDSIFKIPFVGWNLAQNQGVEIKRGDIKSIKVMMKACRERLQRQASIMIFPEGTRSETGKLQPFRDGAFRLACEAKVPLVPIVIKGTRDMLPKHSNNVNFKSDIYVKILPPIDPAEFNYQVPKLRDHVHQLMQEELEGVPAA